MKTRLFQWVVTAALICGAIFFTACNNEPAIENLSGKIIGKWMVADINGKPVITNEKVVLTFVSPNKAYASTSRNDNPQMGGMWVKEIENEVVIKGNKITLTSHPEERKTVIDEFVITQINDKEFTANHKVTLKVAINAEGSTDVTEENVVRFSKVTVDYSKDIIGTWQGHSTSEGTTFDDGQEHRWEYKTDGNYVYYVQNGDKWEAKAADFSEYFVDGNLLCTRWKNVGETENREWWEIESIRSGEEGIVMKWTALREKEDGTTFTASFEMKNATLYISEPDFGPASE